MIYPQKQISRKSAVLLKAIQAKRWGDRQGKGTRRISATSQNVA